MFLSALTARARSRAGEKEVVNVRALPPEENRPLNGNQEWPFSVSVFVPGLADQAWVAQEAGQAASMVETLLPKGPGHPPQLHVYASYVHVEPHFSK